MKNCEYKRIMASVSGGRTGRAGAHNAHGWTKRRGFTLPELLVVIGLSALVFTLTFTTFSSFSTMQSLDKDADVVLSYIQKARNQTINAKNGSEYGIHFSSTTVTLFEGTTYSAGATSSQSYQFSPKTELSALTLTGGTSNIYFEPLTGKPSATGTVAFRSKVNASTTKSVVIYGSGLSETR